MRAMLLAAGFGTRLKPVTSVFAKPAVPFLNIPLMYWSLEFLRELQPDRVVANLHYLPETIRALAPKAEQNGFHLQFTHEVSAPLGSGGALWFAKKELAGAETILVANADEVILPVHPKTLSRMREQHDKSGAIATILTMRHHEAGTKFGGVWSDESHAVYGFGRDRAEFPKATQALHYVGVLLLNRRIFDFMPEGESNILYDAVKSAIAAGERVQAFTEELHWFETGNPKDYLIATDEILKLASPMAAKSLAAETITAVQRRYADPETRYWQSHSGARLLASSYAKGSISEDEICAALEKEKAFAVIGRNAFIQGAVLNSVVLASAEAPIGITRDAIVLPSQSKP